MKTMAYSIQVAVQTIGAVYCTMVLVRVCMEVYRWVVNKYRAYVGLYKLPGPSGFVLTGAVPDMLRNITRFYEWMDDLSVKYGSTLKLPVDLFGNGSIITNSSENVQHILKGGFNNYVKPEKLIEAMRDVFGNGVVVANHASTEDNGKLWKYQRKMIARVFSANNFRMYSKQVFQAQGRRMLMSLKHGQELDLQEFLMEYVTQSIFQIGLGHDEDIVKVQHKKIQRTTELCVHRFAKPWYKYMAWCMPSEYEIKKGVAYMDDLVETVIEKRQKDTIEELASRNDILSSFLKKAFVDKDPEAPVLTKKLLRDIVLTIIMAGSDTTNCLITWAIYEICTHPKVLKKVLKELDETLKGEVPGYDNLKQLSYVDDVMNETLRLHPPIPIEMKSAVKDDYFPDGTFVPAGTIIQFSAWTMGRDPARWENPLEFQPERWAKLEKRPTAYEFPVFQAGPRACPGQAMALIEAKIMMCMLFQQYNIQVLHKKPATYDMNIVLLMKGGLPVRITKR